MARHQGSSTSSSSSSRSAASRAPCHATAARTSSSPSRRRSGPTEVEFRTSPPLRMMIVDAPFTLPPSTTPILPRQFDVDMLSLVAPPRLSDVRHPDQARDAAGPHRPLDRVQRGQRGAAAVGGADLAPPAALLRDRRRQRRPDPDRRLRHQRRRRPAPVRRPLRLRAGRGAARELRRLGQGRLLRRRLRRPRDRPPVQPPPPGLRPGRPVHARRERARAVCRGLVPERRRPDVPLRRRADRRRHPRQPGARLRRRRARPADEARRLANRLARRHELLRRPVAVGLHLQLDHEVHVQRRPDPVLPQCPDRQPAAGACPKAAAGAKGRSCSSPGRVKGSKLTLDPLSVLRGLEPTERPKKSAYSIVLRGPGDRVLARYPFVPAGLERRRRRQAVHPRRRPLQGRRRGRSSSSRASGCIRTVAVSENAPKVASSRRRRAAALGDSVRVRWRGRDADGDRLTYTLLYSDGDGEFTPIASGLRKRSYRSTSRRCRAGRTRSSR